MNLIDRYFAGKKAAITGAGDGIGRALARRLNAAGCSLWLCDINPNALAETLAQLDVSRAPATTSVVDCGSRDDLFAWAESVSAQTDSIDALFNNAGVAYGALFEASSEENFAWLMDINFWGVVHGSRAFLPLLKASARGHLVNLSSIFGMVGIPSQSAYNAAKFAVRGFSEALYAEYRGTALAVSCVHPGGIATNIARAARTDGDDGVRDADARDAHFQRFARTSPQRAADIILTGTAKRKPRIMVGWDAWWILQLTKLLPTSYHVYTARVIDDI